MAEEQVIQQDTPVGVDPTPKRKLYDKLYQSKLYTKSYEDFDKQYSSPEARNKLFDGLSQSQLYTKSRQDFEKQYFTSEPSNRTAFNLPLTDISKVPGQSQPFIDPNNITVPLTRKELDEKAASGKMDSKELLNYYNRDNYENRLRHSDEELAENLYKHGDNAARSIIAEDLTKQRINERLAARTDNTNIRSLLPIEVQKEEERRIKEVISDEDIKRATSNPENRTQILQKAVKQLRSNGKDEEANNIAANMYVVNTGREGDDANARKIEDNIQNIKKGKLDFVNGRLIKPVSGIEAIKEGFKERTESYDLGHELLVGSEENNIKLLNEKVDKLTDPHTPIPVSTSDAAHFIGAEGISTAKGVLPNFIPYIGQVASAALTGEEMGIRGYSDKMVQVYAQQRQLLKEKNPDLSQEEIDKKAYEIANSSAKVSGLTDAALGVLLSRPGGNLNKAERVWEKEAIEAGKRIPKESLSTLKKLGNGIEGLGKDIIKMGTPISVAAGGAQVLKNLHDIGLGIDKKWDDNVAESMKGMLLLHTIFHGAGKLIKEGSKEVKTLYQAFRGMKPNQIQEIGDNLVEDRILSRHEADEITAEINNHLNKINSIPSNIKDSKTLLDITDKIDEYNANRQKLAKEEEGGVHPAFHPAIKERQKEIEWELNLLKETPENQLKILADKKRELQEILTPPEEGKVSKYSNIEKDKARTQLKEIDKKLVEVNDKVESDDYKTEKFVDKYIDEIPGIYKGVANQDAIAFMKDVAEQAQGIDKDGNVLEGGDRRSDMIAQGFPEKLVDKAVELYPAPKPKESKISVIMPDQTPKNETITIEPKGEPEEVREPVSEDITTPKEKGTETTVPENPPATGQGETEGVAPVLKPDEGETTGITHAQMDETAREFGLDTYEGSPETQEGWRTEARKRIDENPNAIPELLDKMEKGSFPTAVEQKMMGYYVASLKARMREKITPELLKEYAKAQELSNVVGGRLTAKSLAARVGEFRVQDDLPTYLRDEAASKGEETLSQEEINKFTDEYNKGQEAKKGYEEGLEKIIEQRVKEELEKIRKTTPKSRKTKEQFASERKAIFSQMRADLLRVAKGDIGMQLTIPGVPQLQVIAKHVPKLIKSYIQEGIVKFEDVVEKMKGDLDAFYDGITDEQVKDLIYGKYKTKQVRPKLDAETQKLQDDYIKFLKETAERRDAESRKRLGTRAKTLNVLDQILGLKRQVQTSIDNSIPFRQGITISANPRHWDILGKALLRQAQTVFSQKRYDRLMFEMQESPIYKEMKEMGVDFTEVNSSDNIKREEDNRTSFLTKIPYLKEPFLATNRLATAFSNVARFERYAKLKRVLEAANITPENDVNAYKEAAKWTNNLTGRGNMVDFLETPKGQRFIGRVLYGARLMASRFNLLNPVYYAKMPKVVRVEALKDMGAFAGTMIATGLALRAGGATISFDPDSPDFMKVRFGDTRYDLTGGLANYLRLYTRLANLGIKATYGRATGNEDLKDLQKEGRSTAYGFEKFFEYKLAPNTSYVISALRGTDPLGRDFDPLDIIKIYPMYVEDLRDAWKDEGATSLATILAPSLFGVGVQTYEDKEKGGGNGGGGGATLDISKPSKTKKQQKPHR